MPTKKAPSARQQTYLRGLWAERLASMWLQLKGYRVLARRLKTPGGEIDLLLQRGRTVVIAEVKQRASHAAGAAALTVRQQQRLRQAARWVLTQRPKLATYTLRFDVLLVNRWGLPYHLPNAFSESD